MQAHSRYLSDELASRKLMCFSARHVFYYTVSGTSFLIFPVIFYKLSRQKKNISSIKILTIIYTYGIMSI